MIVLGIETSCDETAAAVIKDGRILVDLVAGQDEVHASFGGVVPELASRAHLERLSPLIREALFRADVRVSDLSGVAVTSGPGLAVCILVGLLTAKGMAVSAGLPMVGVNHLDGHLSAIGVDPGQEPPSYPHVGLVVSGGHTALFLVEAPGRYRLLGQTIDDAAGEAFDKVAKALGLPYPGGREIEAAAEKGDETAIALPRPLLNRPDYNFSFSGLKTAVLNHLERNGGAEIADVAASFQAAAVDVLVEKSLRAAGEHGVSEIVVAGGVAANGRLRRAFSERGGKRGARVRFPAMRLCTDNASMIAAVGSRMLEEGKRDGLSLAPRPGWPLGQD